MATNHDPLLGTEIGRYRLIRLLGEGGMGRVYLAEHPQIGSRVAIKILSDECTRSPELLDRFFAEARAVNLIRHENIISVLDLAVLPDGRPFIIMEFVEGQTLAQHVRHTVAPLGGVAQVIGEVLSGLSAAHAIGIVHRDLKPDNVIVTVEGHAKVLDFGIAKLAPGLRADVSPRTKTGALLGTPAYMAPEQISGAGNVDARTDIYAAGVVLYEAVTGAVPFTGSTLFDVMRAHLEDAPVPPSHARPDLPPAFEHVILQALAKDPEHRFQSAHAMAQALQHAAASLPPEAWLPLSTRGTPRVSASGVRAPSGAKIHSADALRSTAVAPPPTAARRRRRGIAVVIACAALVALGVTALIVSGGSDTDDGASGVVAAGSSMSSGSGAAAGRSSTGSGATAGGSSMSSGSGAAAGGVSSGSGAAAGGSSVSSGEPVDRSTSGSSASTNKQTTSSSSSSGSGVRSRAPSTPTGTATPSKTTSATSTSPSAPTSITTTGTTTTTSTTQIGGVTIGPGVTLGPGVTIQTSNTKSIRQKPDYDPKNFDPIAYLPKATALARKLLPDARLIGLHVSRTRSDGRGEITDKQDAGFEFRSPSASKLPPGTAPNDPVERGCKVYVYLGASEVVARIIEDDDCNEKLIGPPKCGLASVWKQAIAEGAPANYIARISWLSDENWFMNMGSDGFSGTIPDRCP